MNPKVGIFWFYEGKIIFFHAVPLDVGSATEMRLQA